MNNDDSSHLEAPPDQDGGASSFVDNSQQIRRFYTDFGEQVRQARRQKQITQKELAAMIGINRAYLSEIETGRRRVSLHIAYKLAISLDVSIEALLRDF